MPVLYLPPARVVEFEHAVLSVVESADVLIGDGYSDPVAVPTRPTGRIVSPHDSPTAKRKPFYPPTE